jgi:hypothetical protein
VSLTILGIDPGPTESAYVILHDGHHISQFATVRNEVLVKALNFNVEAAHCAIEQIRGYGIVAGNELFDTCWWSGRFYHEFGEHRTTMLPRKTIATHLCGHARPGDKFIRQALIDRLGAPGTKRQPGPTYGVTGHVWAALAVAVTWWDLNQASPPPAAAAREAEAVR